MARNPMGPLAIELEVLREKAFALQTTGRKMERLIDELKAVEQALAPLSGIDRWPLVKRHSELRAALQEERWKMMVQREALGLTRHDDLDDIYPIPRRITE
ncbi:MAG: hypothetical protein IRZ16_15655 [Myxococcaceae bacterium]|nr:hypothetical protein [Myxococcaceae bacterium]